MEPVSAQAAGLFFNAAKQEVEIILQGISHMIGTVPGLALFTTPGGSSSARVCA